MSLQGRVAVVTGASRGIGREIALTLAREGAKIVVGYRGSKRKAQRTAEAAEAHGVEAISVMTDVTQPEKVKNLTDEVVNRFGRYDILVNTVGEFHWKPVAKCSIEEWLDVVASNLTSVFLTAKFALPVMRRQRWGRIISLGAVGAERTFGQAKIAPYSAAKSGVVAFTRSLALEEASYGITVNVVNPSIVDDRDLTLEEAKKMTDKRFPVGRPATAGDVAAAIRYFVSEDASFVTGQVLNVSGGWML